MAAHVADSTDRTDEPIRAPSRSGLTYKIADSYQERFEAYRLIYQKYLQKGLIAPNAYRLRVTPYHLLPTTTTFIASTGTEVFCTVTLIGDGELGLPMESIYPREVDQARAKELCIGEVSCLAVHEMDLNLFLPIFIKLTRLMTQYARAHGMHQLLIATHPKHARFYQRFMGFEQIAGSKRYPSVRNAPAVACRVEFEKIDRGRPACYEQIFGTPIPISELQPRPIAPLIAEAFRPAATFEDQFILLT